MNTAQTHSSKYIHIHVFYHHKAALLSKVLCIHVFMVVIVLPYLAGQSIAWPQKGWARTP